MWRPLCWCLATRWRGISGRKSIYWRVNKNDGYASLAQIISERQLRELSYHSILQPHLSSAKSKTKRSVSQIRCDDMLACWGHQCRAKLRTSGGLRQMSYSWQGYSATGHEVASE